MDNWRSGDIGIQGDDHDANSINCIYESSRVLSCVIPLTFFQAAAFMVLWACACMANGDCVAPTYDINQMQHELQLARSRKQCSTYRRFASCWSYVLGFIWFIYIMVFLTHLLPKYGSSLLNASCDVRFAAFIVGVVSFCVYEIVVVLESKCSYELQVINTLNSWSGAQETIHELHAAQPAITFRATCWHIMAVPGSTRGRLMNVVSDTINEPFIFDEFVDATADDSELVVAETGISDIKIHQEVKMADSYSQQVLDASFAIFKSKHQHRDANVTCVILYSPSESTIERVMSLPEHGDKPWWVNAKYFWLPTAFLLAWPYRLALRLATRKFVHKISKSVLMHPRPELDQLIAVSQTLRAEMTVPPGSRAVICQPDGGFIGSRVTYVK